MSYYEPAHTCRFCGEWKDQDQMVKYGVRHHAHYKCYLEAGKRFQGLADWQICEFPFRLLQAHGLMAEAEAAHARLKADRRRA